MKVILILRIFWKGLRLPSDPSLHSENQLRMLYPLVLLGFRVCKWVMRSDHYHCFLNLPPKVAKLSLKNIPKCWKSTETFHKCSLNWHWESLHIFEQKSDLNLCVTLGESILKQKNFHKLYVQNAN